jgi:DNA primase
LLIRRLAGTIGMEEDRLARILRGDRSADARFRPATRGSPAPPSARSSLVRQAIALALHHPGAAARAEIPEGLASVELKGIPLLLELLEICKDNPDIGTAGLLERWRERPEHPHLLTLAATELLVSEEVAGTVIEDTLGQIVHRAGPDRRAEDLLSKARGPGLNTDEKEELRELLARGSRTASRDHKSR